MTVDLKAAAKAATAVNLETTEAYALKLLNNGTFAMNEKRTNREVYEAGRRDTVRLGRRAPSAHEQGQAIRSGWDADAKSAGSLTAAQIASITEFPKEKEQAMSAADVIKLKADDPARYQRYRLSAATNGLLGAG